MPLEPAAQSTMRSTDPIVCFNFFPEKNVFFGFLFGQRNRKLIEKVMRTGGKTCDRYLWGGAKVFPQKITIIENILDKGRRILYWLAE